MFTHCPSCNTHFEITQEYLDIAHGQVRCGQCDHIFNALENLYKNETPEVKDTSSQNTLSSTEANTSVTNNSALNTAAPVPNIDIKEKMERIVASLSAATEELKNARKTNTFEKLPDKVNYIEESKKASHFTDTATETTETDKSLFNEELSHIEDTLLADELFQNETSSDFNKTSTEKAPRQIKNTAPDKAPLETKGTLSNETPSEIEKTASDKAVLETKAAIPVKKVSQAGKTEDHSGNKETLPEEDATALEIDVQPPIEEELDIIDFSATKQVQKQPHSVNHLRTQNIDQNDIDILNSLIGSSEQTRPDDKVNAELDNINKTLSDEGSLDDELSSLDDEFDQLDNGDDLLAELEQLESEFLNNSTPAAQNSAPSSSVGIAHDSAHIQEKQSFQTEINSFEEDNTTAHPVDKTVIAPQIHEDIAPSFLTQNDSAGSSPAALLGWLAAAIFFLGVLASQYLHFNSIKLSQDQQIRPLLETLCPLTGCFLPLVKNPEKIVTVTHDVRTHPHINNALEIQLTFKNKAAYTQNYPVLEITFSNPVGEVIARREFLPDDYMTKDSVYTSGLKSNQSQKINLQIVDPDPSSLLSFQFNYL